MKDGADGEVEGARFVPQGERIGHSWMNHFARGVIKAGKFQFWRRKGSHARRVLEYSLSPISSSSALQAAMTAIGSHLRSNFNIMPSTVYLTLAKHN